MINQGDIAPPFAVKDINNHEISLSINGFSFLSFHRFASCPFCVLRTRELINAYPQFKEHSIDIISIWPSQKTNMLKYVGREQALFPMIADDKKILYRQYEVVQSSSWSVLKLLANPSQVWNALQAKYTHMEIDADPNLLPAEFLVSPGGSILLAYYGQHFGDQVGIKRLLEIEGCIEAKGLNEKGS